ncbi:MAG: hypothetical protein QM723_27205 [Myxococcaceae bacterium]
MTALKIRRSTVAVLLTAAATLAVAGAAIAVRWGPHWLAVDDCLDKGGAWDKQLDRCDDGEPPK